MSTFANEVLSSDDAVATAWAAGKSPLPFQIRRFLGRSGNEETILIDRGVGPAFFPSVFITCCYTKTGKAANIRNGTLPDLPTFDADEPDRPGVCVLPCPQAGVPSQVMRAFAALTGLPDDAVRPQAVAAAHEADVQVLAMTRHGPAGAAELSDAVERRWLTSQEAIHDWGFRVGSKLLWVRNSYDRPTGRRRPDGAEETVDLMNGALGVIRRPTAAGAWVSFDDGTEAEVLRHDLGDLLRGWAVTVHKAQGSAFRTVIIPVVPSRLLDRAMLYTAVTRGRERVVLVGDVALAHRVVAAPARAGLRLQALDIEAGMWRLRAAA